MGYHGKREGMNECMMLLLSVRDPGASFRHMS